MSSPAIALNPERLEEIRIERCKEKCMESNQETSFTTPKIKMSLIAWIQVMGILIPGSYFIYEHVVASNNGDAMLKNNQVVMSKHLDVLDVKVDAVSNQVNKIDGKLDVILLLSQSQKQIQTQP